MANSWGRARRSASDLGVRRRHVDREERPRFGQVLRRPERSTGTARAPRRCRAGEMVGEHVRQAAFGGQPGREVRGTEEPDVRDARPPAVSPAAGTSSPCTERATPSGLSMASRFATWSSKRCGVGGLRAAVPQSPVGDRVAARSATDAEVDPAGMRRLEQRELLGDDQRSVVRQHHSAGADPDPAGGGRDHGDQHRRIGRGDGRHVVVLGHPDSACAPAASATRARATLARSASPVDWPVRTGIRSRTDTRRFPGGAASEREREISERHSTAAQRGAQALGHSQRNS